MPEIQEPRQTDPFPELNPAQLRARYDAMLEKFEAFSPLGGIRPLKTIYRHVVNGLLQNCLSNLDVLKNPHIQEADKKISLSIAESSLVDLEFYYDYLSRSREVLERERRIDDRQHEDISA